ncbi:MAG: hypothetical protein JJ992_08135, partial [Planctomycetes bacterium]|nr:hypothetical protein [Planctomycetota bacterium]
MMLIEETTVPDEALPVDQFKAHLRMGTGFGEDSLQDDVLKGYLRAAMAAVEARTAKALLTRDFSLTLSSWWDREGQVLPVAPVASVTRVAIVDALDVATDVPTDRY